MIKLSDDLGHFARENGLVFLEGKLSEDIHLVRIFETHPCETCSFEETLLFFVNMILTSLFFKHCYTRSIIVIINLASIKLSWAKSAKAWLLAWLRLGC